MGARFAARRDPSALDAVRHRPSQRPDPSSAQLYLGSGSANLATDTVLRPTYQLPTLSRICHSTTPMVVSRLDPGALERGIWLGMTAQFGVQAIRPVNAEIAKQHGLGPLPQMPPPPTAPTPEPAEVGWQLSRDGDELNDLGDTL